MNKALIGFTLVSCSIAAAAFAQGRGRGGGGGPPASTPAATHSAAFDRAPDVPAVPRDDSIGTGTKPVPSVRSAAPAAQKLSGSMQSINQAAFAQRRELVGSVDLRLKASREAMKQIQSDAKASRADARADFKAALEEVKASEKAVNAAVKAVDRADEAAWEAKRGALASALQRHDEALNKLETFRLNR